jgi:hypothetical protein
MPPNVRPQSRRDGPQAKSRAHCGSRGPACRSARHEKSPPSRISLGSLRVILKLKHRNE